MSPQPKQGATLGFVALAFAAAVIGWAWFGTRATEQPAVVPADGPAVGTPEPVAGSGQLGSDADRRAVPRDEAAAADRFRVIGRVVTSDGRAVAGARVGAFGSPEPAPTGADGRFEFRVDRVPSVTLLVLAPAHAPLVAVHDQDPERAELDVGDVRLAQGGTIRGSVIDREGNGISGGATVVLDPRSGDWPRGFDLGSIVRPAATAGDGSYAFARLMPGNYHVTASAPGRQAARAARTVIVCEGTVTEVEPIVLEIGYSLTGVVLDSAGAPMRDAAVRIRYRQSRPRVDRALITDVGGRFTAGELPRGPLQVDVGKDGFASFSRADVDPTAGELVVRLDRGIRVTGTVVDARTGRPVEQFAASIRRIGRLGPDAPGDAARQLRRQIEDLRAAAAAVTDPNAREHKLRLAAEFAARLEQLERRQPTQPVAVPADVGAVERRPGGAFAFEGLDAGVYSVGIASPSHRYAELAPVELRGGTPGPSLRIELSEGHPVRGVVVSREDGTPIAGASVELMRESEASQAVVDRRRSLYPWVFAKPGAQGVTVMSTRSARDGGFEFSNAAPGRCFLAIRHAKFADFDTETFEVRSSGVRTFRIAVGARAALVGRVDNVAAWADQGVDVFVLGGHGTMRTERARADGSYRIVDLQPGSYIVRAFPVGSSTQVNRLFGDLFPLHAGAVEAAKILDRDVALAPGETRSFDVSVDLPETGSVAGTVMINGRPGEGGRALLRPVPGEAPGSGGLSLRGDVDPFGRFTIGAVPVGNYVLHVYGATRQELQREPLAVAADQASVVRVDLSAGGLRGRVTTPDATPPEHIRGDLWVLPGADRAPADVRAHRRTHRTQRVRVRDGVFEDAGLSPGPAVLVLELNGWKSIARDVVIPVGATSELELAVVERVQ